MARRTLQRRLGRARRWPARSPGSSRRSLPSATRLRPSARSPCRSPSWTGHRPGQHVDLRLTAEDGYSVERSYSIASEPERAGELDITVERISRRRGLALPARGRHAPATGSSCEARSAATSCGTPRSADRCSWSPAVPASCRSWRCSATVRAPDPASRPACCSAPGTTRRSSTARSSTGSAPADDGLDVVHTLTRSPATRLVGLRPADRRAHARPTCSSRWGSPHGCTSVARRPSSRPRPMGSSAWACRPIESGPSASVRPGHEPEEDPSDDRRPCRESACGGDT